MYLVRGQALYVYQLREFFFFFFFFRINGSDMIVLGAGFLEMAIKSQALIIG